MGVPGARQNPRARVGRAHLDTASKSPISKSADDPKILSPAGFEAGRFVPQSEDALGVLMPEATFRRRAAEDWIGL